MLFFLIKFKLSCIHFLMLLFPMSFQCLHLLIPFTQYIRLYFVVFLAPFRDGISDTSNTTCHEAPGMNPSAGVCRKFILLISILLSELIFHLQGKSRKYLRFLRASGPLTAVVLGTAFVKLFHPSSISLVRTTQMRCTFVCIAQQWQRDILTLEKLEG